jgi:hypothetical protein
MIKAESRLVKASRAGRRNIEIHVVTSINENLKDIADEVLRSELVAIFKQLYKIDPEILLDALKVYEEGFENDKADIDNN